MGYPTVAFTEAQMYNVLKFLLNETMDLTYFTIERMILVSLKGTPTTPQSRREHFRKRTRAQTPGQVGDSDSSLNSKVGVAGYEHINVEEETRNLTSCEESNGTTEMPLVSETFKKSSGKVAAVSPSTTNAPNMTSEGTDVSGFTKDATLSEIMVLTRAENAIGQPRSKKPEDEEGTTAWCSHERGILQEDWVDKIL